MPLYLIPFLDTAAGVRCDTKSVHVTRRAGRYSADAAVCVVAVELIRIVVRMQQLLLVINIHL
jgi:predicted secreted protein